ncbi:hypothetical protein LXL04_033899 [Taraxacum kok-saghyz]
MDKYKVGMRVEIVGHSDGFWNSYYGAIKNSAPGHPLLRPTPRHARLNPSSQQRPFLTAKSRPPRLQLPVRQPGTTAVQVLSFLAQPTSCLPSPRVLQERQNSNRALPALPAKSRGMVGVKAGAKGLTGSCVLGVLGCFSGELLLPATFSSGSGSGVSGR